MSRVNGKERTMATIQGNDEEVPFNPFIMHLAAALSGIDYSSKYCRDPEVLASCQIACSNLFGVDHVNVSTDAYREASAWGVPVRFDTHTPMPALGGHLDWRVFEERDTPDLNASPRIKERVDAVRLMKEQAPNSCVIGWIEAPLAEMVSLFDMTGAINLLITRDGRDAINDILKRIVSVQLEFATMQIEAGADVIGAGDSSISQFGPRHYKSAVLESTTSLFASIKKKTPVLYHACGDISTSDKAGNDMLCLVASTGASVIDIDTQVNLAVARERFGKDACIRGNVSTTVMGSNHYEPERVIAAVEHCLRTGMAGKRFMFAAGCEWPWEPVSLAARNLGIAKAIVARDGQY